MPQKLGIINRIDNETMHAMVCAVTAAGIGYMLGGSVKKAAAAAALAGLGSAAAGDSTDGRLAYATAWTGIILFAPLAGAPYQFDAADFTATGLGTLAGISIWSRSPTKDLDYAGKETGENDEEGKPIMGGVVNPWLPAIAYPPLITLVVSKWGPDWLSPTRVALAIGTGRAVELLRRHIQGTAAWKIDRGLGKWEERAVNAPFTLYSIWKLYGLWQMYKNWER